MSPISAKGSTIFKGKVLPIALIIFSLSLFGGLTWLVSTVTSDEMNEGHNPTPPKSHTLLLVDQTDKLNKRCCIILKSLLEKLPEKIRVGEAVSIFSIYKDSDITITPLLYARNPGRKANEFIENVRHKQQVFQKEFLIPLQQSSNKTIGRAESPSSPILETINNIAGWHKFSPDIPKRKIIIYSDLLQNSVHCSDYNYSKVVHPSATGCPELCDLSNVEVEVYYILRKGKTHLQTPEHRQEWVDRFIKANATTVRFHDVM